MFVNSNVPSTNHALFCLRSISTRSRPAPMSSLDDGSSMASHSHSTKTIFSGADAADAFRKALRKPDFAGHTAEWGTP